MKAMKAMKKKAVSKIAKGRFAKGGLPWIQGQELPWQDCEQEGIPTGQEEQLHQGLDNCRPEGQEGFGPEGLCGNQEGLSSLQEGQGTLPVSIHEHGKASARGVGMSTPLERRSFALSAFL